MDHAARIRRVQEHIQDHEIDGLLITSLVNVRYLCGFSGTNGQLLITPSLAVFFSDPRYAARASSVVSGAEISIYPSRLSDRLLPLATERQVKRLGVEAKAVTLAEFDELKDRLDGMTLVPTSGMIEDFRRRKSVAEIDALREAVALGDRAFAWVLTRLRPGTSERSIALELELKMREWGADEVSFPPIVGSGPLSAHIHHTPTDRKLEKGDLVLLDFGCRLSGYCSDLTRTVVLGSATHDQRAMYEVVHNAQAVGIAAVEPEADGIDVDGAAREVVRVAGMGDKFGHGLGHGVGLEVHEAPRLNKISEDTLAEGDVVTVEPGVYVQEVGGIRIEDCVVVTADGREVLGTAPKDELIEV